MGIGSERLQLAPPRHLLIISRYHPGLYDYVRARFADEDNVEVILDRRRGRDRRASCGRGRRRTPDGGPAGPSAHRRGTADGVDAVRDRRIGRDAYGSAPSGGDASGPICLIVRVSSSTSTSGLARMAATPSRRVTSRLTTSPKADRMTTGISRHASISRSCVSISIPCSDPAGIPRSSTITSGVPLRNASNVSAARGTDRTTKPALRRASSNNPRTASSSSTSRTELGGMANHTAQIGPEEAVNADSTWGVGTVYSAEGAASRSSRRRTALPLAEYAEAAVCRPRRPRRRARLAPPFVP